MVVVVTVEIVAAVKVAVEIVKMVLAVVGFTDPVAVMANQLVQLDYILQEAPNITGDYLVSQSK
ncbi:hypothetical protein G9A89_021242 [Geosiphon pyriformis]|nr:hypothetical protein G9A89_021242 [Geosiphon pyriformis]